MKYPWVSIIVVSHNHIKYVAEAIHSALNQSYHNVEVLVVDDCSTDGTAEKLKSMGQEFRFDSILLDEPTGYCKSFNLGLAAARGDYIIDLAGDDALLFDRVEKGVTGLQSSQAAVDFCDAYYIDEFSKVTGSHYRRDDQGNLLESVASGFIFEDLLQRYFICTPTMMIHRKVLDQLGGYDEHLYYEDFDFWIRSSRYFRYHFTNEILVKKRVLKNSMSKAQYLPNSKMLDSTLRVCQKALPLCRNEDELRALGIRVRYELRQAVISNNYAAARGLQQLLAKVSRNSWETYFWDWLIDKSWNISYLTNFMDKAR